MNFGRREPESEKLAKKARADFDKALAELRRSERAVGIDQACNAISYALTIEKHSSPNGFTTPNYERAVTDPIKRLKGGIED